jgi:translation initiation factor 5
MEFININHETTDPFYRYKMSRVTVKLEGRGNGIKTVFLNIVKVAKDLRREPLHILKYLGYIFGTQVRSVEGNQRFIINGEYSSQEIQQHVHVFIKDFVLCGTCKNPETELQISSRKGIITKFCKACGHSRPIPSNLKLVNFIIKNPSKT